MAERTVDQHSEDISVVWCHRDYRVMPPGLQQPASMPVGGHGWAHLLMCQSAVTPGTIGLNQTARRIWHFFLSERPKIGPICFQTCTRWRTPGK